MLDVSGERVPHSPLESSNKQNISKLDDFSFNTGTHPGQYESSLYGTLTELCKEKKCLSSNQSLIWTTFLQDSQKQRNGTSLILSRILLHPR